MLIFTLTFDELTERGIDAELGCYPNVDRSPSTDDMFEIAERKAS